MCGEERLIWAGRSFWSGDWTLKHGKINREDEEELVCVRGLVVRERGRERDDVVCRERKHSSRVTSHETVIGEK